MCYAKVCAPRLRLKIPSAFHLMTLVDTSVILFLFLSEYQQGQNNACIDLYHQIESISDCCSEYNDLGL